MEHIQNTDLPPSSGSERRCATLLEHPAVGLPFAKRLGKLLLRPNRAFAKPVRRMPDSSSPVALGQLQRLDRHGRRMSNGSAPARRLSSWMIDSMMRAVNSSAQVVASIADVVPRRGDLLHDLLDQAAIRPIEVVGSAEQQVDLAGRQGSGSVGMVAPRSSRPAAQQPPAPKTLPGRNNAGFSAHPPLFQRK